MWALEFWGCSSVGRGKLLYSAASLSKDYKPDMSSGVVAQLVEHLLCKQRVVSSSLISSTRIGRGGKPLFQNNKYKFAKKGVNKHYG